MRVCVFVNKASVCVCFYVRKRKFQHTRTHVIPVTALPVFARIMPLYDTRARRVFTRYVRIVNVYVSVTPYKYALRE